MYLSKFGLLALLTVVGMSSLSPAQARGNDWTIKTGMGEEITIKNGLFGSQTKVVKDRLGDKFVQKKGLFGTQETEVNLLGNRIKKKKGVFGTSDIEGASILGDKITTKKGVFGRRTTTVDLSGLASAVEALLSPKAAPAPQSTNPGGLSTELPAELIGPVDTKSPPVDLGIPSTQP